MLGAKEYWDKKGERRAKSNLTPWPGHLMVRSRNLTCILTLAGKTAQQRWIISGLNGIG
jgi:hypothetical protein